MPRSPAVVTVTRLIALTMLVACGPRPPAHLPPSAEVISVVDGDTIKVRSGDRSENVRLIAIDTPEIAHHGNADQCHGPEAAARLTELLPVGSVVRLERDAEPRDIYDRLLAYVYGPDGTLINLQLVAEGHARPLSITPNTSISDQVANAANAAQRAGLGLWGRCPGDN